MANGMGGGALRPSGIACIAAVYEQSKALSPPAKISAFNLFPGCLGRWRGGRRAASGRAGRWAVSSCDFTAEAFKLGKDERLRRLAAVTNSATALGMSSMSKDEGSPVVAAVEPSSVLATSEDAAGGLSSTEEKNLFSAVPYARWRFLHVRLRRSLLHHGYSSPTKIQLVAVPALLHGHDALIQCPTGLGKTLCLALPLLQRVLQLSQQRRLHRGEGTRGLFLLPTRELALQATETVSKLAQLFPWLTVSALTGGESRKKEKCRLRGGTGVVLATPGRLVDHLSSTASFRLLPLQFLLIDEADRLLDLGFEAKVRGIYTSCLQKIAEEKAIFELQKQAREEWKLQQQPSGRQDDGNRGSDESDADNEQQQLKEIHQQELHYNNNGSSNCSSNGSGTEPPFQVAVASATLTPSVQRLAAFCLRRDPQWLSLALADAAETRMEEVQQLLQREQSERQPQQQEGEAAAAPQQDQLQHDEPLSEELEATILERLCSCSMPRAATAAAAASDRSGKEDPPKFAVPPQLQQFFLVVEPRLRLLPLLSFLLNAEENNKKIVVFVSSCDFVEYLYQLLLRLRWPLTLQHDRQQRQRLLQQQQLMRKLQLQQHEQQQRLHKIAAGIKQQKKKCGKPVSAAAETAAAAVAAEEDEESEPDELADDDVGLEAPGLWGQFVLQSLNVFKLHGKMERDDRIGCMTDFTKLSGEGAVLLATDVAARGLNLPEVDWIIQLEPPQQLEEYVHRIGRTARLGKQGRALLFLLDSEREYTSYLSSRGLTLQELSTPRLFESLLKRAPPSLGLSEGKRSSISRSNTSSSPQQEASLRFLVRQFCEFVAPRKRLIEAARRAFLSSVRAYKTHGKELRAIFDSSKLPLGPLATSFCIRETPKEIAGRINRNPQQQQEQHQQLRQRGKRKGVDNYEMEHQQQTERGNRNKQQRQRQAKRSKQKHLEEQQHHIEVVPSSSSSSPGSNAASRAVNMLQSRGELLTHTTGRKGGLGVRRVKQGEK
ncbi:ATP-dependent RNA helicase DBP7 [Cyclospora cayetanensis]|uniref:ATP-dependent RNA helicase n=1 Tax=Cyclospora cayetanensis TaxID=88456 RepID=A0A6P6RRA1_9EIME|nr:ATP-dependent RNA helicase DBP7 [Cyclospora cayetanensis]